MKRFTPFLLTLVLGCLSLSLQAQSKKIIVVHSVVDNEGEKRVTKKEFSDEAEVKAFLQELRNVNARMSEFHVLRGNMAIEKADLLKEKSENAPTYNNGQYHYSYSYDHGKQNYRQHYGHDKNSQAGHWEEREKAFLGVYPADRVEGVMLTGIVAESGAKAAGLQPGDLITSINGHTVKGDNGLGKVLKNFQPGDQVTINYQRNGIVSQTQATLTAKKYRHWVRDPCKVFIGVWVTTHGTNGRGLNINGIIEETPAEKAALREDDRILALDGVPVNSFRELTVERDKHAPGDWFTLSILRNGLSMEIEAQFTECEEKMEETPEPEVVEETPAATEREDVPTGIDNKLQLEYLKVFPNPTFGILNVQFQGAAEPTSLQIIDAAGKILFEENINQFDGNYQRQIELNAGNPGNLFLVIRQGKKVVTEKISLLIKA